AGERQGANDGEYDEAQHVVEYGGPENDARLVGRIASQVAQYTSRDADARSGESPADEKVACERRGGMEKFHGGETQKQRSKHSEHSNKNSGFTDTFHLADVRFETRQKEQQENCNAGEQVDEGIDCHVVDALHAGKNRGDSLRLWSRR